MILHLGLNFEQDWLTGSSSSSMPPIRFLKDGTMAPRFAQKFATSSNFFNISYHRF